MRVHRLGRSCLSCAYTKLRGPFSGLSRTLTNIVNVEFKTFLSHFSFKLISSEYIFLKVIINYHMFVLLTSDNNFSVYFEHFKSCLNRLIFFIGTLLSSVISLCADIRTRVSIILLDGIMSAHIERF